MNDFQFGMMIGILSFCHFLEELDAPHKEAAIQLTAKLASDKIEQGKGVPIEDIMLEIEDILQEVFHDRQ